jgi:uncharacterized protein (DUF1778 family)
LIANLDLSGKLPYITVMSAVPNRSARLEARIAPDTLAAVKRAAEIAGRSVSDFVVEAARLAAERTIAETQIIRFSLADQELIADILSRPPKITPGLERAFESHRRLIRSSE